MSPYKLQFWRVHGNARQSRGGRRKRSSPTIPSATSARPMWVIAGGSGVYLDVPVDWAEVATIVAAAHDTVAAARGGGRSLR
ncbi:hypothetical protein Rhe02_55970 [Rhizocola hellebori]|uniref:Uncharacterized protein n=1 Tax=Rhizocola hellebori TaxID=1392758 RepID=A0A8J3QBG7_9ACTN|nr:hypothetical protein [Rhizocola hellebori]GIH07530.1 hypothetical protein Rhe02_55970 [Rhizocola hellebori]